MNLDSLLTGENASFIDDMYLEWRQDPTSVEEHWASIFAKWEAEERVGYAPRSPSPATVFQKRTQASTVDVATAAHRQARIAQLINAFRVHGHHEANIDPLGRLQIRKHPELDPFYYDLSSDDLNANVSGVGVYGVGDVISAKDLIRRMRKSYCGGFGIEFMNISDPVKKKWLQERIETLQDQQVLSTERQIRMLKHLADAENFEQLLHNRYPGTKRFSLEGAEPLIPLLASLIDVLGERGTNRVMLGMAHRGRLNVLANIFNKPIRYIIDEFDDEAHHVFEISGDVKYHLGYSNDFITSAGKKVRITLAFNPSHLEAVSPVVEGRTRARQDRIGPGGKKQIVPLIIHGDAAFAGQGVVAETFQMSGLDGYSTGGSIHVVVNNQIGFTTSPSDARSTPYCSDMARMLAIPIFHVNGEDIEAVAAVAQIAAEWRQTFGQDVVIDMYCFRKWGHNEGDEPSYTQPLLYEVIKKHPSAKSLYAEKIIKENNDLSREDVHGIINDSRMRLEAHLHSEVSYDSYTSVGKTEQSRRWSAVLDSKEEFKTAVPMERLQELLRKANSIPDHLKPHRKIVRLLKERMKRVEGALPIDWALGEQAAYATLVTEGFLVRLSGQDSGRGTFSHRHAVLTDITNGSEYLPLNSLEEGQGPFYVYDSFLSEAAVLGFEHGYTLDRPDGLVLWEAQFGDFANGAQIIIDNFIMATEQKWARNSALVMLLPHGYEGQGPEHSSARLERYLQLCAEDNVAVANCTTPANFFHILRRQLHQATRKPLVIMSPKSLLRHPRCISTLDDMATGEFHKVFSDTNADPSSVKRLVFCSGKIYYELLARQEETKESRVAVCRLEQLYPFPAAEVQREIERFDADEVVWCQEEPRNMGAWPMMDEWLGEQLGGRIPRYIGRKRAASPATGSPKVHKREQKEIVDQTFSFE
jgi:2-oxoglutarate dehydrogenase E1 component